MRADPVELRLALLTPENPDEPRAAPAARVGLLAAKAHASPSTSPPAVHGSPGWARGTISSTLAGAVS